jgi:tetratricopeptide (TPR) repeat protein
MRFRELAIVCVLCGSAGADDRLARLADFHYHAGEYYRAITDYEELGLFATDDSTKLFAAIRIAMSYHHGHQLANAVGSYRAALVLAKDPDVSRALRVQLAAARAERTFDEPGSEALDVVIGELEPSATEPRAIYELARLQLVAGRRDDARATAAKLAAPLGPILERALAREPRTHRHPWLGVALSAIVPGSGSVYGGHAVDGAYYFALTGLTAAGAWDVYESSRGWADQKVAFYGLAAAAVVFYAANVIQGYVSVARYNAVTEADERRTLWRDTDQPLPLETYTGSAP